MMRIYLLLFLSLMVVNCTQTRSTSSQNTSGDMNHHQPVQILEKIKYEDMDLLFQVRAASWVENTLTVNVAYGGGCVKPHVFELVTLGKPTAENVIELWLLHKTHNDKCRAMIHEEKTFDLSLIPRKQLKKVKGYTVNNDQTVYPFN